jgi:hypothetical protein
MLATTAAVMFAAAAPLETANQVDGIVLRKKGADRKPTPCLIMNALQLPILSVTAPLPSLVPPVEPEKSRTARAGLLHLRANRQPKGCADTAVKKRKLGPPTLVLIGR